MVSNTVVLVELEQTGITARRVVSAAVVGVLTVVQTRLQVPGTAPLPHVYVVVVVPDCFAVVVVLVEMVVAVCVSLLARPA